VVDDAVAWSGASDFHSFNVQPNLASATRLELKVCVMFPTALFWLPTWTLLPGKPVRQSRELRNSAFLLAECSGRRLGSSVHVVVSPDRTHILVGWIDSGAMKLLS